MNGSVAEVERYGAIGRDLARHAISKWSQFLSIIVRDLDYIERTGDYTALATLKRSIETPTVLRSFYASYLITGWFGTGKGSVGDIDNAFRRVWECLHKISILPATPSKHQIEEAKTVCTDALHKIHTLI